MTKVKGWRTAAILAVFVVAATAGFNYTQNVGLKPAAVVQAAESDAAKQTISVVGSGEMKITPDVAYATLGIQTRAATAEEAQADNAKKFSAVEKVLVDQYKVAKIDIKTVNFNVYPEYNYAEKQTPKVSGYVVTNMIRVTYRDLDKIGELLDDASKAGVNQVNGIEFGTEKHQQYELEVIKLAMANAKAKAQAIASTEGRSVKSVLNVSQQGMSVPTNYPMYYGAKDMAAEGGGFSTPVSGGEITITTTVNVTYEF